MLNALITFFKYSFAEKGNKSIYYLKKIPYLGNLIKDNIYKNTEGKYIYGIIGLIQKILFKFIGKLLFLFLFIYSPAFLINKFLFECDMNDAALQFFIILCCICGSILNSAVFNDREENYKFIKVLRMDPKKYYALRIMMKVSGDFIFFMPAMLIFKIPSPLKVLVILGCLRLIGEYINLILFGKFNFIIAKKSIVVGLSYIIIPILGYVPAACGFIFDFKPLVENLIVILALIVLAGLSFIGVMNFKKYKDIACIMLLKSEIKSVDDLKEDSMFADVRLKKTDKKLLDTRKFESKEGYEYLNSIFFFRHNKLVKRSIEIKCIIITITFIAITVFSLFFSKQDTDELFVSIKGILPVFVFIMYILSSTERITKAMFYNCDLALLRYGFYKRKEDVLLNFKSRIKKILFYNSIPTVLLVIEFSLFIFIIGKGASFIEIVPILISIVSLSCFFSIYSVFMYYILQSYTKDLEVKSPVFSFVNFIMYVACYGCSKIKITSQYFTIAIIAITILFIPISFMVIYKYAPKTFKLK